MLYRLNLFEHTLSECRHKGKRNYKACEQGIGDSKRHIHKYLTGKSLNKYDREEYAYCGECRRCDCTGYLLSAVERRFNWRYAEVAQSVNIFDNYNRVINKHTNAYCKSRQ